MTLWPGGLSVSLSLVFAKAVARSRSKNRLPKEKKKRGCKEDPASTTTGCGHLLRQKFGESRAWTGDEIYTYSGRERKEGSFWTGGNSNASGELLPVLSARGALS